MYILTEVDTFLRNIEIYIPLVYGIHIRTFESSI